MQFKDTATKLGLIEYCETTLFGDSGYGQISNNTNRLYQFTGRINRAQDRFVFLAMTADGRWNYDDNNYTDYGIATTNLVSGQRDYTFALEHLEIEKVLIKDSSGTWTLLTKTIDVSDTFGNSNLAKTYLENNTGNTGMPVAYDKMANSIIFDKSPNYNSTSGLKIYFKRGPSYFAYTDTIKVPGFASIFHEYLALHASVNYAIDRTITIAKDKYTQLAQMEVSIGRFFSTRNKDEKPRLKPLRESTR